MACWNWALSPDCAASWSTAGPDSSMVKLVGCPCSRHERSQCYVICRRTAALKGPKLMHLLCMKTYSGAATGLMALVDVQQGCTGAGRARGEKAGLPGDAAFGAAALPGATAGASAGKGTAAGAATWAAGRRCNQQPQKMKGTLLCSRDVAIWQYQLPHTPSAQNSLSHGM